MIYRILLLLFFALPQLAQGSSVAFTDSTTRGIIQRVVERTFRLEYDQALSTADSILVLLPSHPIGPLLKVGVLYCQMLDFEDMLDLEDFQQNYEKAWEASETLKASGEVAEGELFLGVLLGFKALLHQRQGEWWPAVRWGMKSVGHLKKCLERDSSYADALLGVGTYKYWRSRATDFINWLPFIPDQKAQGIVMVHQAMEQGLFGREISRSTLAWILIDHRQPSEAIALSLEGLEKFPGSRFYLWTLADGYLHTEQWRRGLETYLKLFNSLQPLARNNHYNDVGLCKQIARCYQHLAKPKPALEWVERGLLLPLDETIKKRRAKDLERLKTMKADLEKQLAIAVKKP